MEIFLLVILICVNAFFAASEMAFVTVNEIKVQDKAKKGDKKAKQIKKMLEEPSNFLATIQIGVTFAGFLLSAIASTTFSNQIAKVLKIIFTSISFNTLETISVILITVILSLITLIFGELVPKRLAMKYSEKIAYMSIGTIYLISKITAPFVKFLTFSTNSISKLFKVSEIYEQNITEEEIKIMINHGNEKGIIREDEKELINNVFELNDICVGEIMKHRTEIFSLNMQMSLDEILKELEQNNYSNSRIPVYEETIDEIIGVVYVKDILKNISNEGFSLKKIVKEIYYVSENKLINEVFKEMQKKKIQIAIALDEYGGTAGLITMEDILEELVGDIFDEYDKEESQYEKIDENTYVLSGNINIYVVEKLLNVQIPEGSYDTISGYMVNLLRKDTL